MRVFQLTAVSLLIAGLHGCGGGGGGGDVLASSGTTLSGTVIDGYIKGAIVCLDTNSNQKCDAPSIDPQATTKEDGSYSFTYSGSIAGMHVIAEVPVGAIDSDLGAITKSYSLLAPAVAESSSAPSVITPLTTLVSSEMLSNKTSAVDAEASVKANLNLSTALVGYDFKKAGDANSTAVAQITAAAIASATSTMNSDTTISAGGLSSGEIAKKAIEQVKNNVLPQVISSTGKVTVNDSSSQDKVIAQITTAVTNTISGQAQNIVSSTKSGDGKVTDISSVFKTGLNIINAKESGQYKNSTNSIIGVNNAIQVEEIKFDLAAKSSVPNYQKLLVDGVWFDKYISSENLLFDGGTAWVDGVNGNLSATTPVINGNCVDLSQALNGSVFLTACGVAKDLSGKKIADVMPDFCKESSGNKNPNCDVNSTFPANSIAYDFTLSYKNDTYDLNVGTNWEGYQTLPANSEKMADFIAYSQKYETFRSSDCVVAFKITEYDLKSQKGKIGWRDTGAKSCSDYRNPSQQPTFTETTNFEVKSLGGKDVLVYEDSNLHRNYSGSTQGYQFFAYHKGSKKSGFWNGDFNPAKFKDSLPFSGYINTSPQTVSPTLLDFMLKQLGITSFTHPQ